MKHPLSTSRRASQRGTTLVELMIGVAVGLFLVAVTGTIYLGSKATFLAQDAVARLQENGRFAMDAIGADLRMAGFRGCLGQGNGTPLVSTLNVPAGSLLDFGIALGVSRKVGASWSPALDPALAALTPAPSAAGDVVTVRRPVGQGWALVAEMADGNAALTVGAPAALRKGDLLMVTDCGGAAVFQASNADPGGSGSIEHATGGGLAPDMTTGSLGRAFLQDALVYRMQTVTYYLAPSARSDKAGLMSLWVFTQPAYDGSAQPAELVTGVERMAVTLGVDTDGDRNADRYLAPEAVGAGATAVTARIELLFASLQDNVTIAPQPYAFAGVDQVPTDRRLRTSMVLVSSLRNALP